MERHFSTRQSCPDALTLDPLLKEAEGYTIQKASSDLWAAVSVALLSVPQAIAYSMVAGVPPIAGLISMILGTSIAALLSSSSHTVIGPNNATALLVQAASISVLQKYTNSPLGGVELIAFLTLLIGIVQLLAAFFKLGRLIQFVSHAVVVAYIAGTAAAIAIGQLFPLTGILCPDGLDTLYQKLVYCVLHINEAHGVTLVVGGFSLAFIILLRRCRWRIPASLTMLAVMTAGVYFCNFCAPREWGIALVACHDVSLLHLSMSLPFFDLQATNALLPTAFAIALIGMLEANTIGKSIAAKTGQRLVGNQEVFALGCSNFFLSFFGGLPCSGSATRSSLNVDCGAQTRFSAVFSGGIVAVLILGLGSVIEYIPRASLAALLIATAVRLVDVQQIRLCWQATRSDALVLLVTFVSCIFFSLPLAFYMGVALSLILYLRKAATPHVVEYTFHETTGEVRPAFDHEMAASKEIRMINVEGELFFGAMDLFGHSLRAFAEDDVATKVIILRLKHVHDLDATTALALRQIKDYLERSNRYLIVCSVPPHVLELLENVHLIDLLGRENVILCDDQPPHTELKRAFARARTLMHANRVEEPVPEASMRLALVQESP